MAKSKAGFPENYKLPSFTQPNAGDAKPAAVGDYLDETTRPNLRMPPRRAPETLSDEQAEEVLPASERSLPEPRSRVPETTPSPAPVDRESASIEAAVGGRRRGSAATRPASMIEPVTPPAPRPRPMPARAQRPARTRMQFNMDLEVERALDDVLDYLRTYAPQEVSASEVLSGLVLALKDSLAHVEAQELPERGQWGSDSHKQFPHFLKAEFLRAFGRFRGKGE